MGDILFSLICMANDMDIDLDKAFKKTLKKYDARDKDRWTIKD